MVKIKNTKSKKTNKKNKKPVSKHKLIGFSILAVAVLSAGIFGGTEIYKNKKLSNMKADAANWTRLWSPYHSDRNMAAVACKDYSSSGQHWTISALFGKPSTMVSPSHYERSVVNHGPEYTINSYASNGSTMRRQVNGTGYYFGILGGLRPSIIHTTQFFVIYQDKHPYKVIYAHDPAYGISASSAVQKAAQKLARAHNVAYQSTSSLSVC